MSIYEAIGGLKSVDAAVEEFYRRVLADPSLSGFFGGVDMDRLKRHQRAFMVAALGGPQAYFGRDMASAHAGLGVTSADFDAVVGHLADTLTSLGVPADTIEQIAAALVQLKDDIVSAPASATAGRHPASVRPAPSQAL